MERAGYWYYTTQRPPAPGAVPKRGLVDMYEYEYRLYVPAIGRKAWGSVVYDRELTQEEIEDYELVQMPNEPWKEGDYRYED